MGVVPAEDPRREPPGEGAEPVWLHRRRYAACAAAGATVCHVDASKGIVAWGKDNAVASGLTDKPIRCWWTTAPSSWRGKSAGATPTTASSWTAQLRARPRRRDLEAGGLHLRPHQPVRRGAQRYPAVLCGQQLYHRPVPGGHGVYAQDHAGAPLWRQNQLRRDRSAGVCHRRRGALRRHRDLGRMKVKYYLSHGDSRD